MALKKNKKWLLLKLHINNWKLNPFSAFNCHITIKMQIQIYKNLFQITLIKGNIVQPKTKTNQNNNNKT